MSLEIRIHVSKTGCFTVVPKGRIDTETAPLLEKKVRPLGESKKARGVLIDMAGVDYISSAGLGAIFGLMKKLKANGGALFVCGLKPSIRKVFEIIKVLPSSSIFPGAKEADEHLNRLLLK